MNYLKDKIDEGWSVQIYGRDRRLLFSLYPSHAWTFLAGLVIGLLFALVAAQHSTPPSSLTSPSSVSPSPNPDEPLLKVD